MIPNDVDPSLCAGDSLLDTLEDGFSPPQHEAEDTCASHADSGEPPEQALGTKSPF